jgi:hypothetical protein
MKLNRNVVWPAVYKWFSTTPVMEMLEDYIITCSMKSNAKDVCHTLLY